MNDNISENAISIDFLKVFNLLEKESQRRLFAAYKAKELGHGGIKKIKEITGLSYPTIQKGMRELETLETTKTNKIIFDRESGRPKIEESNPRILSDLSKILLEGKNLQLKEEELTKKSFVEIAEKLENKGHKVSLNTIRRMINDFNRDSERFYTGTSVNPRRKAGYPRGFV